MDKLTRKQEDLFESLGGRYTCEEMDEFIEILSINEEIVERLKEQGVSHYLYEDDEYIEEIREGRIICEGIDIEEIKAKLNQQQI